MANKLTIKERKFVNEYVDTGNSSRSAIVAGYSPKSARSIGYENLTKHHIQTALEVALANAGIDDATLASAIARLLNSDDERSVNNAIGHIIKLKGLEKPRKSIAVKMNILKW